MSFPKTGDTVYWADGKKTTLTLISDPVTGTFPSTDTEFFRWFGENWAQRPEGGNRGIRQKLMVDADTIPILSRLMALMVEGDNEWGLPSVAQHSDLLIHIIAATKFPGGWSASSERRKYMPGSVASDPRPKPPVDPPKPTVDPEIDRLKSLVETLEWAVRELDAEIANGEGMRQEVRNEITKAIKKIGSKPAGKWWQDYKRTVDAIASIVTPK